MVFFLASDNDSGTPRAARSIWVSPAGPVAVIGGPIVQEFA